MSAERNERLQALRYNDSPVVNPLVLLLLDELEQMAEGVGIADGIADGRGRLWLQTRAFLDHLVGRRAGRTAALHAHPDKSCTSRTASIQIGAKSVQRDRGATETVFCWPKINDGVASEWEEVGTSGSDTPL